MSKKYKTYSDTWLEEPSVSQSLICPVCNTGEFYQEGEYVDFGVGYQKCSPDTCHQCGYIESNGMMNQLPLNYYKIRWETGIDPLPPKPSLNKGKIPKVYQEYINNLTGNPYGNCEKETRKMKEQFPNLETVYGYYYCPIWGQRNHFFLYDPDLNNLIIDPTAKQFPSKGIGVYEVNYPIDIFTLKRTDYLIAENTLMNTLFL